MFLWNDFSDLQYHRKYLENSSEEIATKTLDYLLQSVSLVVIHSLIRIAVKMFP